MSMVGVGARVTRCSPSSRRRAQINVVVAAMAVRMTQHWSTTTDAAMHVTTTRRDCLGRGVAAAAVSAFSLAQSTTTAEAADLESECANGALAVEEAVPGAYEQACMALPARSIPIRRPDGNNHTSVVVLEIEQRASSSLSGSTGMVVWNSSILLARLLERMAIIDRTALVDQTVLELGCGTGLVSLAAACLRAGRVVATDGNPAVVELAAANIDRNRRATIDAIQAVPLPWGLLAAADYNETADLVVGSDLTYYSGNWPALAETISTVLKPTGSLLYLSLGHAGFNVQAELDGFLSVASGYGLMPPAANAAWTEQYLTNLLMRECMSPKERSTVQNSGGVRVVVLRRM